MEVVTVVEVNRIDKFERPRLAFTRSTHIELRPTLFAVASTARPKVLRPC